MPVLLVLVVLIGTARAGENPRATRDAAWEAYRYQLYDVAERRFQAVADDPHASAPTHEADLGLAMVAQFREQGPDYERAQRGYRQMLEDGVDGLLRWQALSFMAECLAARGELPQANALWDEVVRGAPESLVAQDALLRRTLANLGAFDAPETGAAIAHLEAARSGFPTPTREQPGLAPAMDLLLGTVYYWRHDYARARAALIRYVAIGTLSTTSYAQQATAMMRIARLSETVLDDPATAARYYRMLVEEAPNDVRSYFALEQAVRYGALTEPEVRALGLHGITETRLRELFAHRERAP